jgi:hypothetical protein
MEGATNAATTLTPIPGTYFSSYASLPPVFNAPVFSNGQLTISWTSTGTLKGSTNVALPFAQWTTVTTTSPYQVTPATNGPRWFYRLVQ